MLNLTFRIAQATDLDDLNLHPPQDGAVCHHEEHVNAADGTYLLALQDGHVVGHGFIRWSGFHLPGLRSGAPDHAAILSVCVWPSSLQGRGIGSALIRELERRALNLGRNKVALPVYVDHKRVRSFYDRLGYTEWDSQPVVAAYPDGHPDGVTVFRKILQ